MGVGQRRDINFICQAGPGGDGLGDFTGNTNNTIYLRCQMFKSSILRTKQATF